MSTAKFEVLPKPIKSESDKKEYKVIKLKNELVACLISDSKKISNEADVSKKTKSKDDKKLNNDEKRAAAMLCVGVGSFNNPKDIQGLPHFLEHMVFMGSKKFPMENDFNSFISKRGGTFNAFTSFERTVFYFDCLEKHLNESLDRFAQFFIEPLMKKESMTREREAVDSEYQMAKMSDAVRKQQLFLSLATEGSPVNTFAWGNLETLRDNIDDEQLYTRVHEFWSRHYSAHRMTLAIQSTRSIKALQDLVIECFSAVPNNKLPKDDFSAFIPDLFNNPEFNKIYYIKPIEEEITLDLNWWLFPLYDKYKAKSLDYIAFVLGNEAKGSLLSYLKKRMWIVGGSAYSLDMTLYSMFSFCVMLTEEGLKNLNDVIKAIFSYLKLMKTIGPQKYIYDDMKVINDNGFRFETEETAAATVLSLQESMQLYPPEDYITGPRLYYEFNPKEITMIMNNLTVDKVNISVTTKDLPEGVNLTKVEKWFKAEYESIKIPTDLKTKWENVEPYSEFKIIEANPYLSKDFSILPANLNHPEYPQKIMCNNKFELWYRQDQKFNLPFAYYRLLITSPTASNSAKNSALAEVFTSLLIFCLDEKTYLAQLAGLSYYFYYFERGFGLYVSGYNHKLSMFVEEVVKYIIELSAHITEEMFIGIRDLHIRSLFNNILKPRHLAYETREKLLLNNYWTNLEKYNELLKLTYFDLKQFIVDCRQYLYIKALVQGNISSDIANKSVFRIVDLLNYTALSVDKYPKFVVTKLPRGEKSLYLESFNKLDSNSITENYYQIGPYTLRDSVISSIIMMIMEEPIFDFLRTKEHLGYSVYGRVCETEGILGYTISVNSQIHKFSTKYLDSRIEAFLKYSLKILEDTKPEDFEQVKADYINSKQCVDVQLIQELNRNWSEIYNDYYMFNRKKQEIETAKSITLDDIRIWWSDHNLFGIQQNFRKLTTQVAGHIQREKKLREESTGDKTVDNMYGKPLSLVYLGNNTENQKRDDPDFFIEDIAAFKNKLDTYPPKPTKTGP